MVKWKRKRDGETHDGGVVQTQKHKAVAVREHTVHGAVAGLDAVALQLPCACAVDHRQIHQQLVERGFEVGVDALGFHDGEERVQQHTRVRGVVERIRRPREAMAETDVEATGDADDLFPNVDGRRDVRFSEHVDRARMRRSGGPVGGVGARRVEAAVGLEPLHVVHHVHDDQVDEDPDVGFVVPTEDACAAVKRVD